MKEAEIVIYAFVSSRSDYCNALFPTLPSSTTRSFQFVQNAAAIISSKLHITLILAFLQCLPMQTRADFKVLLLTVKALHGLGPKYLSELIILYTLACRLRSLDAGLLVIPSFNKKSVGFRAFAYSAPFLWNGLSLHVIEAHSV